MTWYADEAPCDYFAAFAPDSTSSLRAIGWLERGRPFPTGPTNRDVYDRLAQFMKAPWQPAVTLGRHECDLCQFEPSASGTANLFLPADGFLYVCPELILHYINAHAYAPPASFCSAVLACPDMGTIAYRRAILANGGRGLATTG